MKKIILLMLPALLFMAKPAAAQCENPISATATFTSTANRIVKDINSFIKQEQTFFEKKIGYTATQEVQIRLDEFDDNIREGLTELWTFYFLPSLRQMTAQLSVARVDQARTLGSMMDAQVMNEFVQEMDSREAEARQRYKPSESGCQEDSVGPGQIKADRMATALAGSYAMEDQQRRAGQAGTPAAQGKGAEQKRQWSEYVELFCDPARGMQGCAAPGRLPGMNTDISGILWGNKQTVDMTNPDNQVMMQAVLQYLVSPTAMDPVPAAAVNSPQGQAALLQRHTKNARQNAVYNVIGRMVSEHASGSGTDTQGIRVAAGLPPGDAATDASYREIQNAMAKDRFHDPAYIVLMVDDPVTLVRWQQSLNTTRMQTMRDHYKRLEEMMFMEAAVYANDMDKELPPSLFEAMPMR